jgi:hypothetical protein
MHIEGSINIVFGSYFVEHQKFPENLGVFYASLQVDSEEITSFYKECLFLDPFGKNGELLLYYPLYDRKTDSVKSYIFLSRGEDGIFNNNIKKKLYTDDWPNKIKSYNIDDILPEINETKLWYPVFLKNQKRFVHFSHNVDDKYLETGDILLRGDTLFDNHIIDSYTWDYPASSLSIFYPKFSRWRAMFGRKDYIVAYGRKITRYEIVPKE